jgi:hypothetical protein
LKRVEGAEKIVGGRQRHLVDKALCRGDRAPIKGGDPSRKRIDKAVQLRVGIVKDAKPKVYKGAPHGMCTTRKDEVNEDLLAFVKN